jgi:hypothetical protein
MREKNPDEVRSLFSKKKRLSLSLVSDTFFHPSIIVKEKCQTDLIRCSFTPFSVFLIRTSTTYLPCEPQITHWLTIFLWKLSFFSFHLIQQPTKIKLENNDPNHWTDGRKKIEDMYHPTVERSEFYTMSDVLKPAVLFTPSEELEKVRLR